MPVGDERHVVWGLQGYLKVLVRTNKYLNEEDAPDGKAGYYECIHIEEPKAVKP
jgi:hypothetical protein